MSDFHVQISDDEIATLNAAREVLDGFRERLAEMWPEQKFENHMCGRISEAAEQAEGSLFSLLNITSNGGGRPMTFEQIHNRPDPDAWERDARSPSLPDHQGLPISDPRVHTLREEGA